MQVNPDRVVELLSGGNVRAPFLDDALTYARDLYANDPAGYADYVARLKATKKLDVALFRKQVEKQPDAESNSRAVNFDEVTTWPEPVDGLALLNEVRQCINKYVRLPARALTAATISTSS